MVNLPSVLSPGHPDRADALAAANITRPGQNITGLVVNDALQILRFVVNLPSDLDKYYGR
jgi:hypothetical protein